MKIRKISLLLLKCLLILWEMTDIFYFIEYLFVEILFIPLDFLRVLELKNWFLSNSVNFLFITVVSSALIYWTVQLMGFSKRGEEDTDQSAHSFL